MLFCNGCTDMSSENAYLSKMINTGEALTVRMMLPLGTYSPPSRAQTPDRLG